MKTAPNGAALAAPQPLAGKVAVVTGATGGLGRSIAKAFAEAGAEVVLVARDAAALGVLADEIGPTSSTMPVDLGDLTAVSELLGSLLRVDILVNNAGTNRPMPFEQVTSEDFDHLMNLNLRGAFFSAQAVLGSMPTGGVILNIGSQMGHVGAKNRTVYCATKHGLEGLTKALAVELAPRGIRVVSLAPTFVETPMTRPMFADAAFRDEVLSRIPMGQLGQPEDVAAAAVFLASDAARMVTGTSLLIDGGWTAQ